MAATHPSSDSFLPLTPAEYHILLVLAVAPAHGYSIMQAVRQQTQGAVNLGPGTLYSTLKRLLDRAWISELEAADEATSERRRRYSLTDTGRQVVRAEAERLAQAVQTARQIGLLPGEA